MPARLALVIGIGLIALACAQPLVDSPPRPPPTPNPAAAAPQTPQPPERWEQLERRCSLDDNPPLLATRDHELFTEAITTVPVTVDPTLEVETRWASLGFWDEHGDLVWKPARLESDERRLGHPGPGESRLVMHLRHTDTGTLEILVSPYAYRFESIAISATVTPKDDELRAELEGYHSQDYGPFRTPWQWIRGELRLSSASWRAGEELSAFIEVASSYELRICAELRLVVPERGHSVTLACSEGVCN